MSKLAVSPQPSSGSTGFFQSLPNVSNAFLHDDSLRRVLKLYGPADIHASIVPSLTAFGDLVLSKQVLDWVSDAELHPPFLRGAGYDALGKRTDELVTSEGWRRLQNINISEGIVAISYEPTYTPFNRLVQFVKYHLWAPSSAFTVCPSAMTDGAAVVLKAELAKDAFYDHTTRTVLQDTLARLISRDPAIAWTSGQWMTERAGGSDVSGTETIATSVGSPPITEIFSQSISGQPLPLGPWRVDGFKWFSSATDGDMALFLAKTTKGLSCFFAPTWRLRTLSHSGTSGVETKAREELNGIRIQRLKSKLGTRALPTAELELDGMYAYLLGKEGEGIKTISSVLNVSRIHNAVTAVSLLGRGLGIVRAYASVRKVNRGKLLHTMPLFRRTIATLVVEYRAAMLLTFFIAALLGQAEHLSFSRASMYPAPFLIPENLAQTKGLLRVLTPAAKAITAKVSISGLQECMECLGGLGYLEHDGNQDINIARLFRDANVLSIWEGTTDVLASDLVKILLKGEIDRMAGKENALDHLEVWMGNALDGAISFGNLTEGPRQDCPTRLMEAWTALKELVATTEESELLAGARDILFRLGAIVCGVLLYVDAATDGDEIAEEICERFMKAKIAPTRIGEGKEGRSERTRETASRMDGLVAFGQIGEKDRESSKL